MPDSQKKDQTQDRYEEMDEKEKVPHYEQRKWEEEQMSSAVFHFGSKDKKQKAKLKEQIKEYELVLDDQIEFIQSLQIPGTKKSKVIFFSINLFELNYKNKFYIV